MKDLGFGDEVGRRTGRRLLNRDGSFNIRREGYSLVRSRSLYNSLLDVTWGRFFQLFIFAYILVNLIFGMGYFLCGAGSLDGATGVSGGERFMDCFFFSVQTFATIGFGRISPHGVPANLLVTVEALIGLLGFALATGLLFARFSRPTARIIYSRRAIVAPYRGISAFEFRIANERKNQIIDLEARVVMSRMELDGAELKRRFYELSLERRQVMFFPLHWTIVHPITPESPMFDVTEDQLRRSNAEFLVLLAGTDDTFSQVVYSRSSYRYDEMVWGAKFSNILEDLSDGTTRIDLNRIHDIESAPLPGAS